jgi:hypothetical protein
VIGPGAIGGTIAAWISRSPLVGDLTLCVRTPLDKLVVEAPDGTIIEATPRVVTDPARITAPVDWVLVATKAYDVAAAALWLKPLLGPQTRVAVLQNGVEHVERFTPFLPAERIVPVIVDDPRRADRAGPHSPSPQRQRHHAGGEAGEAFAALFADSVIEGIDHRRLPDRRLDQAVAELRRGGQRPDRSAGRGGAGRGDGRPDAHPGVGMRARRPGGRRRSGRRHPGLGRGPGHDLAGGFGELPAGRPAGGAADGMGCAERRHRPAGQGARRRDARQRHGLDPAGGGFGWSAYA